MRKPRRRTEPLMTLPERFSRIHSPGPATERHDQRLQRQALALAQREPLAERRVGARDEYLVDGLAGLPRARPAEMRDRAAERLERRARRRHVRVLADRTAVGLGPCAHLPTRPNGASTAPAPRSASAAATRRAVSGAIVEQSSRRRRLRMPSAMPPRPSTTASTSGESATQRQTSSAPAAASRGVLRTPHRARRGELTLPRAVWNVSSCPASSSCPAILSPIVPSPIPMPIFIGAAG